MSNKLKSYLSCSIKVLKIRALFEDYGNGILKDGDLVETIDIIKQAKDLAEYKLRVKQAKDKAENKAHAAMLRAKKAAKK